MRGTEDILLSSINEQAEQIQNDMDYYKKKDNVPKTVTSKADDSDVDTHDVFDSNENSSKTSSVNSKTKKRGRPFNADKGIINRKQISLTLKSDTHTEVVEKAKEEGLTVSVYVERAVLEYMKNHYDEDKSI